MSILSKMFFITEERNSQLLFRGDFVITCVALLQLANLLEMKIYFECTQKAEIRA